MAKQKKEAPLNTLDVKELEQRLEKSQEEVGVTPVYKLIEEMGPDHDKRFKMAIYFDDKYIAEGDGKSKQEAESAAAKAALIARGWIKE